MTSMPHDPLTVSQAGEDAVVEVLRRVIDPHNAGRPGLFLGPGDDAAVLTCFSAQTVITTDTLSEGQDFRRQWWAGSPAKEWPQDVGTKAAAQNLSDLNAMAATPTALLISLTLPPEFSVDWVRDFYQGVVRACSQTGAQQCVVAGGDLGSGPEMSVTITALGEPREKGRLLKRDGARAGDVLAVSGVLGYAAAGLALLEQSMKPVSSEPAAHAWEALTGIAAQCVAAQKRPQPPLTAGVTAVRAQASAGMDLSDGLMRDCSRLARASDVRITFDDAALAAEARVLEPVARQLGLSDSVCRDWVLTGGEDFALLAAFPPEVPLPEGFRRLGSIESGPAGVSAETLGTHRGWDSMRSE
ncbi:thiamine-phosphate kinase [Nesterenkonia salmonea]|uniref:Thiamine-monophosphate kinase n=2 Tax=Nesterenkonia salmonea TaxID=1804987 RepID=A0A5R9BN59_9MICC|nr:thiamine-phosphate kinase [Nesterenkonia salmonea]